MGQMLSGLMGSGDGWGGGSVGDPGLGGGMSSGAGFTGVTDTGAGYTGVAPDVGIQPGGVTPQGTSDVGQANALTNAHRGMSALQAIAMQFGDSPQERTDNARAFASLIDQLGKMGKEVAGSTIMQRVMQGRIRPIGIISPTQQSQGVAAMPSTFSPDMAQSIMSRMGYK